MGKLSKEELARYNGADWMLRLVKQNGIEAAEKELAVRGQFDIPMGIGRADLVAFINSTKEKNVQAITMLTSLILKDVFGYGKIRLSRFIERFNSMTDVLLDDTCSWEDIAETLEAKTGLEFTVPKACTHDKLQKG